MLWRYDVIISESDNDIGQTDLIQMHKATKPDAAWPYPLAPKHHDLLKQEIKNLLDTRIICKSMSPWASPIVIVKKHTPKGAQQQFHLCIDYRKKSYYPAVTQAVGTKKCPFTLIPLSKIDELFALLKGVRYFTALDLRTGYYHIKLDEESIPKSAFTAVFGKFEYLRLQFGLSQGQIFYLSYLWALWTQ